MATASDVPIGGVDGVAAADPVPEAEGVVRVDAEGRHLVERGGDGDEVLGDCGIGGVLAGLDGAGRREAPSSSQLRASRALVRVSSVVKVLEATMNSVVSGSRSSVFSATSVGSMLETKRALRPGFTYGWSAS